MFELDMLSYLMGKKAGGGGGAAVEQVEKTVEPDFSGGDMVVLPDAGKAFSKVTVEQPENLIAENIAEGVNIAGVVGALAAGGGGGGEFVSAEQDFTPSSSSYTFEHNLGVVPCFAMVACKSLSSEKTSDTYLYAAAGVSTELKDKLGLSRYSINAWYNSSSKVLRANFGADSIDESGTELHSATTTTIKAGSGTRKLITGTAYHIVVIGYKTGS